MASCDPFDVTVTGDPATVFNQVKTTVESQGGVVNGDQNSGTISLSIPVLGTVQGNYVISGQTVTITVTQKPFLLPCSEIESEVTDILGSTS
jgi:archaellum component FlaF (FlaF/FlaG flagellin family)